jgi:hypothetical protein
VSIRQQLRLQERPQRERNKTKHGNARNVYSGKPSEPCQPGGKKQKFFVSFFQKRNTSLLVLFQ